MKRYDFNDPYNTFFEDAAACIGMAAVGFGVIMVVLYLWENGLPL